MSEPGQSVQDHDTGNQANQADTITSLAQLTPVEYDRVRKEKAKLLGVRVKTLDDIVQKLRLHSVKPNSTGAPFFFEDPAPWQDPVDGAALLHELSQAYDRHAVLPEGGAAALALWTLHTHAFEASQSSPLLGLLSPRERCGKTTVIDILGALVRRPLTVSNITPASLYRSIELWQPTLLIDEADTFLAKRDELRGIVNSGHTRNTAFVIRSVGDNHEPHRFPTWAPKAIAMIGELPRTLADRAILIHMRRKLPTEKVERLRADHRARFQDMQRRCIRWTQDYIEQLRAREPAIPEALHDRAADNWRPLCAIAEIAGGEWVDRVKVAIEALSRSDTNDTSAGGQLLEDIQEIFQGGQYTKIFSQELCAALHDRELRPWSEWNRGKPITPRQVARLLEPFGIRPNTIRISNDVRKGYGREQFEDAFARYLPDLSVTPLHPCIDADFRHNGAVTGAVTARPYVERVA